MSKEQYVNGMYDALVLHVSDWPCAVTVLQYGEDLKRMNFSGR